MAVIGQARPGGMTIRTPLFVLGVALALLAFLAMFAFGLLFSRGVSGGTEIRAVVAQRDIQPREPISDEMLTIAAAPSSTASISHRIRGDDPAHERAAGRGGVRRSG